MHAVAVERYLPIEDEAALLDVELPRPRPEGHDLLVRVEAVSVNPVDVKVRAPKDGAAVPPRVLGWDAAGVVEAVGEAVTLFRPGDAVYYAGSLDRPGSNAEYQLVDERIVAHKPETLDMARAAALPLTGLTAWEGLFDRLRIDPDGGDAGKSLLVIGGAGGVGSMVIQLARLAGLRVSATASREASADWCRRLGAERIVSHAGDLAANAKAAGLAQADYIFCAHSTADHFDAMAGLIAPQGAIVSIVETKAPLDMQKLMWKSAAFHWELMFTRPVHGTPDLIRQHEILQRIAALVDAGRLRDTLTATLSPIEAATLREAHRRLERGDMIGKLVVQGWR